LNGYNLLIEAGKTATPLNVALPDADLADHRLRAGSELGMQGRPSKTGHTDPYAHHR